MRKTVNRLPPESLYQYADPELFDFESTDQVDGHIEFGGQQRAVSAVEFGVEIADSGYNIFALGPAGTGKKFMVEHLLARGAEKKPSPDDLCYVFNFQEASRPRALYLPSGKGARFKSDLDWLVDELKSALPAVFETEEYQARLQAIEEEFKRRPAGRFETLQETAQQRGFKVIHTPVGIMFAPVRDGEVITPEAFERLPDDEKEHLQAELKDLQEELRKVLREVPRWERQKREQTRELDRETANLAVGHLIDDLRSRYRDHPAATAHLDAVHRDLVDNARGLLQALEKDGAAAAEGAAARSASAAQLFRRYQANLLVDHSESGGAPVVSEDHPTYSNLLGRIEYLPQMGTLVTDFSMIRAGALHRANGGYLVLEAAGVLRHPFAWEGLKRALKSRQIKIESLAQDLSLVHTVSLEPTPVDLDVKVVLLGDRWLYYLLCALDPEFSELFKVAADFDDAVNRDQENQQRMVQLIASLAKSSQLKPFDRTGVARVVEQMARLAGDAEKLSAHTRSIADLLSESSYWAGRSGHELVTGEDVQRAIDSQVYRSDRARQRLQEEILRDTLHIATDGAKVGQINGLSVIPLGMFAFARPQRITATTRLGKGEVVDIEREVELSGPIHSKGVLILSGFIGARYAADAPLSLSASLVFEQSYSGVDGDSASAAELYALLSAIAGVPIKQALAVTGSVNQHGDVQAIGAVNEKIEGFFDICVQRGLTGDQGVIIPATNVKHLMLKQDVIDAVANGDFHVYPISTVDQGVELLMGIDAGERHDTGSYPEDTLNFRVDERLRELASKRQEYDEAALRGRVR